MNGARPADAASANDRRRERLADSQGTRPQEGAVDQTREPLPTRVSDTPELPAAYHAALDAALPSIGVELPPGAREIIDGHMRLLLVWTEAINLTAIRDPAEAARLHVLDSLAAVPLLRARGVRRLLDLGSGGGFPGIPLAAALDTERTLLVDSVAKKVRFLTTVIEATGLTERAAAEAARAETLAHAPGDRGAWQAVTARAVTSLAELVEIGLPLVAAGGVLVAWKRGDLDDEFAAARPVLRALGARQVNVIDIGLPGLEARRLVVVEAGGPVDARYPRDPAERRRRPL
jgi:16S rRNA (guanine527-N7)-methyltransferase